MCDGESDNSDPMRSKQLKAGLVQLGEEGAIQVFRPHNGSGLLLGGAMVIRKARLGGKGGVGGKS